MVKKYDSSVRVLTVVLTVAFGLIAAVIAYATFKGGSFELRSKAATEEVILKQWKFDASSEGWEAKDFLSSKIAGGMYRLTVNSNKQITELKKDCTYKDKREKTICRSVPVKRELSPNIVNNTVQTNLLYPVNKFRIRVAVTGPKISERPRIMMAEEKIIEKSSTQPVYKAYPFVMKVSQKFQGKTLVDTEQQISAIADGKEHEYSFEFSRASSLKRVDELQIQFISLPPEIDTVVSINDIAIIGMKEIKPTITKEPPSQVQTLNGFVRTYEGVAGSTSQYKLVIPSVVIGETRSRPPQPVYSKEQEYLLTQSNVSPCGGSKGAEIICKYIVRPQKIDFSVYLDKYVTATGVVLTADDTREVAKPKSGTRATIEGITYEDNLKLPPFPAPTAMPLPTFVVSTMRLAGISVSPSPSPIQCGVGVKTFTPGKSTTCSQDYYLGMFYTCFDGYSGMVDEGTKCTSYDALKQKVTAICAGRTNCPETSVKPVSPMPTYNYPPSPSTSVIQYPTSTPPPYTSIMYTPTPTSTQ